MKTKNNLSVEKPICICLLAFFSSCSVVKTDYSDATLKKGQIYYYLPESVLKITVTTKVLVSYGPSKELLDESKIVEQSVLLDSEIIADTQNMLALQYQPNAFFNDEIKFSINTKGLLQTIDVSTEDRTPEIIKVLSEAPGVIMGVNLDGKGEAEGYSKIVEFKNEFKIRYASLLDIQKLDIILSIVNENDPTKFQSLDASVQLEKQVAKAVAQKTYANTEDVLTVPAKITKTTASDANTTINGILTRPVKNVDFVVNYLKFPKANPKDEIKSLPITVSIMDVDKILNVPLTRASFVKKTNNIALTDGVVVSNEIKKPSSVEGFLSIPINIAKAIVSVPAQLIQLRIDTTNRNKNLETAVKDLNAAVLENEKQALTKQNELDKVKMEIAKDSLTRSQELEKLKITLETELTNTKAALLEAQAKLKELEEKIKSGGK